MMYLRVGRLVPVLLVMAGLLSGADAGETADSKAFWDAWQDWHAMANNIAKVFSDEAVRVRVANAAKEGAKIKSRYAGFKGVQYREHEYRKFVGRHQKKKGALPMVRLCENSILMLHLAYPQFKTKAEQLEKKMRSSWKKIGINKVYRKTCYAALYNRYTVDKKWKDAVRIADEFYRTYDWSWADSRGWLGNVIAAAEKDSDLDDFLYAMIDEFHDRYHEQLYADKSMQKYLDILERHQRCDQGASIAEELLAAYKNCIWEPAILSRAAKMHTMRWDAQVAARVTAEEEAAEAAAAEAAGDAGKPPAKKAPKKKTSTKKSSFGKKSGIKRTYKPKRRKPYKGNSLARAVEIGQRAVKVYPYSTETYTTLLTLLDWVIRIGNDVPEETVSTVFRLVAQHLDDHKAAPGWNVLYKRGTTYADTMEIDWSDVETMATEALVADRLRTERWEELKKDEDRSKDPTAYAPKLLEFIESAPESAQARQATTELLNIVTSKEQRMHAEQNVPLAAKCLKKAFPKSPSFLSTSLMRLANTYTLEFADFIYYDYIKSTKKGLMQEYYYCQGTRRYIRNQTYNVKAVEEYVKKYPDSYDVPEVVRQTIHWALYEGHPEDAGRVGLLVRDDRYKNSMTVYGTLQGQMVHWIPAARRKVAGMEERWQKKWAHHDALFAVEQDRIGMFLDKHFTGKLQDGGMYVHIMLGCPKLRLRKCRKRTAIEVLKGRPYREKFHYYRWSVYNR